jgi:tetratricopeptide (TPR) repeat protein
MKKILTILFLALGVSASAAPYYEFSPKLKKAYQKAISLRFAEARTLVAEVKSQEPENVLVHYVENYIDFLKIYIDEDYVEFQRLEKNKDRRISLLKSGPSSSPYYLYTQGELRLHWAVARVKFGEYKTAALEVRKGYLLLEKNKKRFPDFMANRKSLGVMYCLIGAIPENYQWVAKLAGMKGTLEQGRREIEKVLEYAKTHDFIFEEETLIMYALVALHVGNEGQAAWNMVRRSDLDPSVNPLVCFAQASIAMHTGRSDKAISILKKRPKGKQFHSFHYLDYMMGLCKLYRQDSDAAYYLNRYVINFKGRHYIKECYQRIAWFELINGNKKGYTTNMAKVLTLGHAEIDGDKKALKEAKKRETPNLVLLKSRLLFDGGYLSKARQVLDQAGAETFHGEKDLLEYHYRRGRVLQSLGQDAEAIIAFNRTIEKGMNLPYYFACNAALQAGLIKEKQRDYEGARAYFKVCQKMEPDEYRSGIHGKAKAGENRIKGK